MVAALFFPMSKFGESKRGTLNTILVSRGQMGPGQSDLGGVLKDRSA